MTNWLYNLHIGWMALVIFTASYCVAAAVYWIVTRLAIDDRARAFKALSPGMLPPLGIIFGLLVGFVAVQVWNDFDKAKLAVATEASSLRAVVLLGETLPAEQRMHLLEVRPEAASISVVRVIVVSAYVQKKRPPRESEF